MNDKTVKEIHISKETLVKRVLPAMIMLILVGLIAASVLIIVLLRKLLPRFLPEEVVK